MRDTAHPYVIDCTTSLLRSTPFKSTRQSWYHYTSHSSNFASGLVVNLRFRHLVSIFGCFLLTRHSALPPFLAMNRFADASSAELNGAAPYLVQSGQHAPSQFLTQHNGGEETHQAMTAIPKKALTQLNTSATMPLAVKPAGRGAMLLF